MPDLRQPKPLTDLTFETVVGAVYDFCVLGKNESVEKWISFVPPSYNQQLWEEVQSRAEEATVTGHLGQQFFSSARKLLNNNIKKLKLSETLFQEKQDLVDFLSNSTSFQSLVKFEVSKGIVQLCQEALHPAIEGVSYLPNLSTFILPSLHSIYPQDQQDNSILELLQQLGNCNKLRQLELPGTVFTEGCFNQLLRLRQLIHLNLDGCKMTTIMVVQLLTGLSQLHRLDCTVGRQSKVVQAISALPPSCSLNLSHMTWRQPPRFPISNLPCLLPRLTTATVIYNVFEAGYASAIDDGLVELSQFQDLNHVSLEISTINMLYVIQLGPKIEIISTLITRVELLEPEFLHPACLEPIATLPNLTHLTIINPAIIGDDMFLELPELTQTPYASLTHLLYEGSLAEHVLTHLTIHSPSLEVLTIKSSQSQLKPNCLKHLHLSPRNQLKNLQVEMTISTSGEKFILEIIKILESSPILEQLGNSQNWKNVRASQLGKLKATIRNNNWNVQFK